MHDLPLPRGADFIEHLKNAKRLDRLVAVLRPNLVHAHFSAAVFTTALAFRGHWPATIGTFHGLRFPLLTGFKRRLFTTLEAWSAQRMDAVWVLTEDDRLALTSADTKATVRSYRSCGVGCDLDSFDRSRVDLEGCRVLRTDLHLADDQWIFAFVGRYVAFKGFGLTIRAFLRLAELDPKVHLLLMGGYDGLHPTGLTPQEEFQLRCSKRITDLGWQNDVGRYLAITDVLIAPSNREGIPVSLMEAMAMGVPAITRDSRGCREVVQDKVNGLILRDGTVESLVDGMRSLKENQVLYRFLSKNALASRNRFDRVSYVKEQIRIYGNLIG